MHVDEHVKTEAVVCAILTAAAMQKAPSNPTTAPEMQAITIYKTILTLMRANSGPFTS